MKRIRISQREYIAVNHGLPGDETSKIQSCKHCTDDDGCIFVIIIYYYHFFAYPQVKLSRLNLN